MRAITAHETFAPDIPGRVAPAHPHAALAGFIAAAMLAALPSLGLNLRGTYSSLALPEWAPPDWLFGPVWTILYVMMGVAAWGVWKTRGWGAALAIWAGQLVLNAAWTPIFFGLHQPGWAFAEIMLLWFAVAACFLAFAREKPWAGLLLTPYLTWVTFATALNYVIWGMND